LFSVIIPLFNKERQVVQTIESVLAQTFTCFELIIVDDGSTDNSLGMVNSINDSRIKFYSKKNEGVSSARNFGINKANYNFIALLDADDLWDVKYLEEIYNLISSNRSFSVFASNYKINLGSQRYYIPKFILKNKVTIVPTDRYFDYSNHDTILTSSSIVFNKRVIELTGYFDTYLTHGEDLDYWIRISRNFEIVFLNNCLVTYNYDASNRSINKVPEFNQLIISKYDLIGDLNHDKFISKAAFRFAIFYLLNGNNTNVFLCIARIEKNSLLYFKIMFFRFLPENIRALLFKFHMKLFNHNVN
jgi:glycosyltransferase involved in cell wall biosynthesis